MTDGYLFDIDPDDEVFFGSVAKASGVTIPDVTDLDSHGAARAYAEGGVYVVPVCRSDPKNPGSRLGTGWPRLSTRDPLVIATYWAGRSDGIAVHAGRSGLIIFDVDNPDQVPAPLARAIAECRGPFQRSRPNNPECGHHVFGVPDGRRFGNGTGKLGGDWGQVRGTNGVIIAEPSPHQDAADGAAYEWVRTGSVPVLPDYVADLLPEATETNDAATDAQVEAFHAEHVRAARPELAKGWVTQFHKHIADGASRHDSMVSKATGAMKEARAGYFASKSAADMLRTAFIEAVTDGRHGGRTRTAHAAQSEWNGILSWAIAQANGADLEAVHQRVRDKVPTSFDDVFDTSGPASNGSTANTAPPNVDAGTGERIAGTGPPPNLPENFWEARPVLAAIRQAAHARGRSADAVLGAVLAHVAALTPPSIQLPAVVGTVGTLDVCVGVVGPSGVGKSSSVAVGAELVPIDTDGVLVAPIGSGEGVAEAYIGTVDEVGDDGKTRQVRRQVRTGYLALVDEGATIADLGRRSGSTLLPVLRTAWSGGALGQQNASAERRRIIPARGYRFAAIAGWQTTTAAALLGADEIAAGTPQRWLWLPATDPTIPDTSPPWPGPIHYQPPVHQAGPMGVDDEVAGEIQRRDRATARGGPPPSTLDSHRDLGRQKVAGLLALLDGGRLHIGADDWALAGQVMDTSDAMRTHVIDVARTRAHADEQARTRVHVLRAAALDTDAEGRALTGMARAIGRHVHRGGCEGGCRRRCVSRSTKSAHRALASIDDALDDASQRGWVVVTEDGIIRAGDEQP